MIYKSTASFQNEEKTAVLLFLGTSSEFEAVSVDSLAYEAAKNDFSQTFKRLTECEAANTSNASFSSETVSTSSADLRMTDSQFQYTQVRHHMPTLNYNTQLHV